MTLHNTSDDLVRIGHGDIIGHIKEATYGTCAFLTWNEENKTLQVKSNQDAFKDIKG